MIAVTVDTVADTPDTQHQHHHAWPAGRHRRSKRARQTLPRRTVELVDARDGQAHHLTPDAIAAGRGARGRYFALCGVEVLPAALVDPGSGRCSSCTSVPDQRSRKSR